MIKISLLISLYLTTIIGLFLYSYTQVDLSLTLSRLSIWQVVEKNFQYIGYFQRPLSTGLYSVLLFLLFSTFLGLLFAIHKKMLPQKAVWILIIVTAGLLTFSYNAFSYDLFNYIFDAKIVTHYHLNPYLYKALDFPHDPMLSFMHWTQRTYPYGPIWLLISVPVSFIGMQIFLPTFFLFKLIASISYLGTAYFIQKIAQKIFPQDHLFILAAFAFQPLVLIEALVSGHNDISMIFLTTLSLSLLLDKKYIRSSIVLILSIGVKYASAIYVPIYVFLAFIKSKNAKTYYEKALIIAVILSLVPIVFASARTNFQPWYFLYVLPFAALSSKKYYISIPYIVFSLFALLQYVPFLFTGNWDPPIPGQLVFLSQLGIALSALGVFGAMLYNLFVAKK